MRYTHVEHTVADTEKGEILQKIYSYKTIIIPCKLHATILYSRGVETVGRNSHNCVYSCEEKLLHVIQNSSIIFIYNMILHAVL